MNQPARDQSQEETVERGIKLRVPHLAIWVYIVSRCWSVIRRARRVIAGDKQVCMYPPIFLFLCFLLTLTPRRDRCQQWGEKLKKAVDQAKYESAPNRWTCTVQFIQLDPSWSPSSLAPHQVHNHTMSNPLELFVVHPFLQSLSGIHFFQLQRSRSWSR
jgi:hypothetical protein